MTGTGLSTGADTDGDGLNGLAELNMAPQGFDWQTSQAALVSNLVTHANSAELYTPAQVQALHVDVPLIQRDPGTGILNPADGFYEWQKIGAGKQPYNLQLKSGEPFAFAGIWEVVARTRRREVADVLNHHREAK